MNPFHASQKFSSIDNFPNKYTQFNNFQGMPLDLTRPLPEPTHPFLFLFKCIFQKLETEGNESGQKQLNEGRKNPLRRADDEIN